ncbi:hypothetical protein CAP36_07175 [Chitinophagaceae bacterium IBVUCB2]|nr:hypothetical protein CAP36_07175 [Chitinophagaceae bacterium IBVUCB2]
MASDRYNRKEFLIFVWVMFPYVAGLNAIIFGSCIFQSLQLFIVSFSLTGIFVMFLGYYLFGYVAALINKRFPLNSDLFRRIGTMLPVFYVMNILLITGLYTYHNLLEMLSCPALPSRFWWAVLYACVTSSILTFINEGVANWEAWKISVTETEQLKNNYQKTKLLGLRGQVNPHFLFNCFNSLSSLINENEAEAEKFLNEMTKVHRYMLGCDDEQLVTLEEELKFAHSYLYLIETRFGNAITTSITIDKGAEKKYLPPLSLHIVLEKIIYTNSASKTDPLQINISSKDNKLFITNTVNLKCIKKNAACEEGLDNLVKKYKLLNKPAVELSNTPTICEIILPLIDQEEVMI